MFPFLFQVFYSDEPMVICAPTGSGKTVLFELAIIRMLLCHGLEADLEYKIVYSKLAFISYLNRIFTDFTFLIR